MLIRTIVMLLLMFELCSCSGKDRKLAVHGPGDQAIDSTVQSEEYAVFSFLLDSLYADPEELKVRVRSFMLIDKTIEQSRLSDPRGQSYLSRLDVHIPGLSLDSLYRSFEMVNARSASLRAQSLTCRLNVILMPESTLDSLFGGTIGRLTDWPRFYKMYPQTRGLAQISRVAFDLRRDQALVYWEREREPLVGYGEFVFLARKAHVWSIVATRQVWVS
jgi:hypothetical protein